MSSRAEIIEVIQSLGGPIGPFQSVDDYLSSMDRWIAKRGPEVLDELIDLATHRPSPVELGPGSPEDFYNMLGEMLSIAAQQNPAAAVPSLARHLEDDRVRPLIVEALGATGDSAALARIAEFIAREDRLSEDELMQLVEAVNEIGGESASAVLASIRSSRARDLPKLARRIDLLLQGDEHQE
jgi:HEAT repeat protein